MMSQSEIRLLEARLSRAERALKPFAEIALTRDRTAKGDDMIDGPDLAITPTHVRAARKALSHL